MHVSIEGQIYGAGAATPAKRDKRREREHARLTTTRPEAMSGFARRPGRMRYSATPCSGAASGASMPGTGAPL